jgi:hypothetical protein
MDKHNLLCTYVYFMFVCVCVYFIVQILYPKVV